MKKPIQLSIASPCHENWDNMTPADKGRFCASCQKRVVDFTRSSDREILEAIKTGGQACGRFRASQLNRDLVAPQEKSRLWATAGAAAMALLTLGVNETAAQTPASTEQRESHSKNEDKKVETDTFKMISGTVIDEYGMPIPGVNVKIKGEVGGVETDFDGNFSIEVKLNDVLEFSYPGMITQKMKVAQKMKYDIVLQDDIRFLEDIFVGQYDSPHIGVASEFMFGY